MLDNGDSAKHLVPEAGQIRSSPEAGVVEPLAEGVDAFISYRRADGSRATRWLRRRLLEFRLPRALRHRRSGPLRIYVDEIYVRATEDYYARVIRPALVGARYLIVIATPKAVAAPLAGRSDWVAREIEDYLATGKTSVFCVIASRAIGQALPGALDQRFPQIERVDLSSRSWFWFLRPGAKNPGRELLKLVAPLHKLERDDMPVLIREQERRRLRRTLVALVAVIGVIGMLATLSFVALRSLIRARESLAEMHLSRGRELATAAPATARLHFVEAVHVAESPPLGLPWLALPSAARTARAWLGQYPRTLDAVVFDTSEPTASATSRDGARVIIGEYSGRVALWDVRGRRLVTRVDAGGPVNLVAFGDRDRRIVALVSRANHEELRVWDVNGAAAALPAPGGATGDQYASNAQFLLITRGDGRSYAWDLEHWTATGDPIAIPGQGTLRVLSPDGAAIAGGGIGEPITVMNLRDGRARTQREGPDSSAAPVFSSDSARCAVPEGARAFRVIDTASATPLGPPVAVSGMIAALAFSQDGRTLAVLHYASDDVGIGAGKALSVFDAASGQLRFPAVPADSDTLHIAFGPGDDEVLVLGRRRITFLTRAGLQSSQLETPVEIGGYVDAPSRGRIAALGITGPSYILDTRAHRISSRALEHHAFVDHAEFSANEGQLLTSASDGVRMWPLDAGQRCRELTAEAPPPGGCSIIGTALAGDEFAAACLDGSLLRWSWEGGSRGRAHVATRPLSLSYSPDGRAYAVATGDAVHVFARANDAEQKIPVAASAVRWTRDGRWLVTSTEAGTVHRYEARSLARNDPPLPAVPGLTSFDVSPDGRWLATASLDGTLSVWNLDAGARIATLITGNQNVVHTEFDANGRRLAAGLAGGQARVFDTSTWKAIGQPIPVRQLALRAHFSADSARLVTTSPRGETRVWDPETGAPITDVMTTRPMAIEARFDDARVHLVTAGLDGRATVWDASSGTPMGSPFELGAPVIDVGWDPTGTRFAAAAASGVFFCAAESATDDLGSLQLAAERSSGLTLDADGVVRTLGANEPR